MRTVARWLLVAMSSAGFLCHAQAQDYPTGPITMVLPYPPGSSVDAMARILQPKLEAALGQPLVIDNKPGGNGNIGSNYALRQKPDGQTILLSTNAVMTLNPTIYKHFPFDVFKDVQPITIATGGAIGFGVQSSLPVKTIPELIDYAGRHPGEITFGTSGTPQQIAGELLNRMGNVKMVHVPYKGTGPAVNDLLGGHIKMVISGLPVFLPHMEAGTIRMLALADKQRYALQPQIPVVAEYYPDFEVTTWFGFFVPAGTPRPIVDRLNKEFVSILNMPDVKSKFDQMALPVIANSPEDAMAMIKADYEKWAKFIPTVGIKEE